MGLGRSILLLVVVAIAGWGQFLLGGWWAIAVMGVVWGFFLHSHPGQGRLYAIGISMLGVARLISLKLSGAEILKTADVLAGVAGINRWLVLALAIIVPALVGYTATRVGAMLGRRMLFD